MRRNKNKLIKNILIYSVVNTILLGNTIPALAYSNSVDSIKETQTASSDKTSSCEVYAQLASTFTVRIPKKITLSGTDKTGSYSVDVEGDVGGIDIINVVPDASVALKSTNLANVTATINQNKTAWSYSEILPSSKATGSGFICADGSNNSGEITAGSWNGTFNFNISLKENSGLITVEAKNESGEDLNASASEIVGTEKESLLNSLVDSGLVNSLDEVDALIEVESDEFSEMAETTFNVSSIANEGDKIAILHFDEETSKWEYVSTETVNSDGTITADFSSYSPVAFVKVNENGDLDAIAEQAGLYDINGNLLCTWEESGIDVETDYTYDNYNTSTTSGYYTLTKKYPTATKIVLPDEITSVGKFAFYQCTKLKNITLSSGITSIGEDAFRDCRSLIEVSIPSNVNSIGNCAFFQCYSLSKVVISEGIKHIGQQSFAACNNFTNINIPLSIESLGYGAFMGNNKLISVTYNETIYTNITKLTTDLENNGVIVNKYGVFDNTGLIN